MTMPLNSKKYNQLFPLNCYPKLLFLMMVLIQLGMTFEFKAPSIKVQPETINTISQYTFTMYRQLTNTLGSTPWNTEPVPLDAQIIIEFPSEYTLTGNEQCPYIILGFTPLFSVTCSVDTTLNKVIISDVITADNQNIGDFSVQLSNIVNPTPAITTGSFLIRIGNDYSATDHSSTVTLVPDELQSATITFDPSTVSTESNMIIEITTTNDLPPQSKIRVQFPSSLQWARDLDNNQIPISGVLSCTGMSANIEISLNCEGSIATQEVTITNINPSTVINAGSTIKFSINSLTSPPTQQQIDSIILKTYVKEDDILDRSSSRISGLVAKQFTTFSIKQLNTDKSVNTKIGLIFNFILLDTMGKKDQIQIRFPIGTQIDYQASFTVLSLAQPNYDITTGILSFMQNSNSQEWSASTDISITFIYFTTPSSTKPIDISLWILTSGFAKMKGTNSFAANEKMYVGITNAASLKINSKTQFTLKFDLTDQLMPTGYFIITIPPELSDYDSSFSASILSSNSGINENPIVSLTGNIVTLTNLNKTSSATGIPIQNLIITLNQFSLPNSVQEISPFSIDIYHSNEGYKTAKVIQSNTITSEPGQLSTVSITVYKTGTTIIQTQVSAHSDLLLEFQIENQIPMNGYFFIGVGNLIIQGSLSCEVKDHLQSDIQNICTQDGNRIKIEITAKKIEAGQALKILINSVETPKSTYKSLPLSIKSYTSTGHLIDKSVDVLTIKMNSIPLLPTPLSFIRNSQQNLKSTTYTLNIHADFQIYTQTELLSLEGISFKNILYLVIPGEISYIEGTTNVYRVDGSTDTLITPNNLGVATDNSGRKFSCFGILLGDQTANFQYSIKIVDMLNPVSLEPTPTGFGIFLGFKTESHSSFPLQLLQLFINPSVPVQPTNVYLYKWSKSNPIQNTETLPMADLQYTFSNRQILQQTEIKLIYQEIDSANTYPGTTLLVKSIVLELASDLSINKDQNSDYFLQTCQLLEGTQAETASCSVIDSPLRIKIDLQSPINIEAKITIDLGKILNPTSLLANYGYSKLFTYSANGFLISQSISNIVFVPKCQLPCKDCIEVIVSSETVEYCLDCFHNNNGVTNKVYYLEALNSDGESKGYGNCVENCPSGYFQLLQSELGYCRICQLPCIQCADKATTCTSCDKNTQNHILHNQQCVSSCPENTYIKQDPLGENTCKDCVIPCATCQSDQQCLSCQSTYNYYADTKKCLETCPLDITVVNTDTKICQNCIDSCKTCSGLTSTCTSCNDGFFLQQSVCVSECQGLLEQKTVVVDGVCTTCSSQCSTCTDTPTKCTKCENQLYLYNNECKSECPQFYFKKQNKCVSCSQADPSINCIDCEPDGIACKVCDVGFFDFFDPQLGYLTCIDYVPDGYIEINDELVKCTDPCKTCIVQPDQCNGCSLPLYLSEKKCVSECPDKTATIENPDFPQCQKCQQPCIQCSSSVSSCLNCISGYIYDPVDKQCLDQNSENIESLCPDQYYANFDTKRCQKCGTNCLECQLSPANCTSCSQSFLFIEQNQGQCITSCRDGWFGKDNLCQKCQNQCHTCVQSANHCLSCKQSYYFNQLNSQCTEECPLGTTIQQNQQMKCLKCSQGCQQCFFNVDNCTVCDDDYFTYQNNLQYSCVTTCPQKFYPSNTSCLACPKSCSKCQSQTVCIQCTTDFYFHKNQCVSSCPSQFYGGEKICNQCSEAIQGCKQCSKSDTCSKCTTGSFLFEGKCHEQCPQGFVQDENSTQMKCIDASQYADEKLTQSLTAGSIFPMPFTIVGVALFVAIFMSKLQNKNTYLVGSAYSLLGVLETASLVFLIISYSNQRTINSPDERLLQQFLAYQQQKMLLLLVVLGIIYFINFVGLVSQTPILLMDDKFMHWKRNTCNHIIFWVVTFLSFITNYKLKLILFSKLFSFGWVRSQMQSVQKFRIFNVLSFLGAIHQILLIYLCVVMLINTANFKGNFNPFETPIFLVFIDTCVIVVVSMIFAIASNKKQENFFEEEQGNGYVLNKKMRLTEEDYSKQAIPPKYLIGIENKDNKNLESHDMLDQVIYEDEQLSLSISDNRSELRSDREKHNKEDQVKDPSRDMKQSKTSFRNQQQQLYFVNEQSSNPIHKQMLKGENSSISSNENEQSKDTMGRSMIMKKKEQQMISKNKTMLFESPTKDRNPNEQSNNSPINQNQDSSPNKNSEESGKPFKLKKSPQTKVYSRARKPSTEANDQIDQMIKAKQAQLNSLRKSASKKDLKQDPPENQAIQENNQIRNIFDKQIQSEQSEEQCNFKTKQQQPLSDKADEKPQIYQNSTLVKLQQQNKEEQETTRKEKQKQQQLIQENIDVTHSIHVNQQKVHQNDEEGHKSIPDNTENNGSYHQSSNKPSITPLTHGQNQLNPQNKSGINQTNKNNQSIHDNISGYLSTIKPNQSEIDDHADISQKGGQHVQEKGNEYAQEKKEKKIPQNMFDSILKQSTTFPNKGKQQQQIPQQNKNLEDENIEDDQVHHKIKRKSSPQRKYKMFELQQDLEKQFEDDDIQPEVKKPNKKYDFQESSSGLEDSQLQHDQEINHRPLQSSFARSQRSREGSIQKPQELENNKKIIEILKQNADNQDQTELMADIHRNNQYMKAKKREQEEDESESDIKSFSRFTSQDQTVRLRNKPPIQKNMRPSTTDKSRMYYAGMKQLQEGTLTKKNSVNHPLHDRRQKVHGTDSSDILQNEHYLSKQQSEKKKNKSLYNVPFKKQTSNSLSHNDEIQFISKNSSETSEFNTHLLNRYPRERSAQFDSSTINPDPSNKPPEKPIISETARNSYGNIGRKLMTSQQKRNRGSRMVEQADDLRQYYGMKKRNTHESIQRSPASNKSRSGSKQKNRESSKRARQLQKIYLQRLEAPKRR